MTNRGPALSRPAGPQPGQPGLPPDFPAADRRAGRGRTVQVQARTLRRLVREPPDAIRPRPSVRSDRRRRDFQAAVPIRTYESLWDEYLRDRYPVFEDLTWPGRIPYLALTSGTTQGATKYIPVSGRWSHRTARPPGRCWPITAPSHPDSRLFRGRLFFLGGSAQLRQVAPGV